jgi:hypothetical protein
MIETNQRILALSSGDGPEGNRGRAGLIPAIKRHLELDL